MYVYTDVCIYVYTYIHNAAFMVLCIYVFTQGNMYGMHICIYIFMYDPRSVSQNGNFVKQFTQQNL